MTTLATRPGYRLKLHHIESCNCQHGCGCQFNGLPLGGNCEFIIGFQVIEGKCGTTDLTGAKFVVAAKYPKAIHEGNGQVVVYVDSSLKPPQVAALAGIMTGQYGGMPWEALAGTVGSLDGPISKPIEMKVNGNRSSFRIEGELEVRMTPLKDVVSGEEKDVHVVYPKGGFLWDDGDICTSDTMRIKHGNVSFEYPGRYSAYAVANWTNQS